jgi:cytochrome c553
MRIFPFLLLAVPLWAQSDLARRGEQVFRTDCSVPYCHGASGMAGRAPKLVGHKFTENQLFHIVSEGIQNTGMPAFAAQLKTDEIEAVVAYVMTLKASPSDAGSTKAATPSMPPELETGKALFFDSTRMGGCGRCHALGNRGSAVAPGIKIDSGSTDVRSVHTNTFTAQPSDEAPFPAVVVERSDKWIRVYDLSSPLPVLRSFKPDRINLTSGSSWQHREAVSEYSDAELRSIEAYLPWALQGKK